MKSKRLIFGLGLWGLAFGVVDTAQAQVGGIGFRVGGYSAGISGKYFFKDDLAFEGILGNGFSRLGFQMTGLFEKHHPAFGLDGLQWFYGGGAHVGSFKGRHYYRPSHRRYTESYNKSLMTVGIDGIVGLEYQITEIPLSVGLDFKPFIETNQDGVFLLPEGALTVRYTF